MGSQVAESAAMVQVVVYVPWEGLVVVACPAAGHTAHQTGNTLQTDVMGAIQMEEAQSIEVERLELEVVELTDKIAVVVVERALMAESADTMVCTLDYWVSVLVLAQRLAEAGKTV